MGSPVSPIVCNVYMEQFEKQALRTSPHPPDGSASSMTPTPNRSLNVSRSSQSTSTPLTPT
ncbi:hypothetical protein DPMN_092545 [Dreissena polymorpha]|uniref:Uncharacterized protein n=1 Tax=Dreissena polymorpha TaxID=45954 RepID=A0A9D4R096_DREPO|nr:hypothetical protein DPMN_092545 [Dreissena polymorpha]